MKINEKLRTILRTTMKHNFQKFNLEDFNIVSLNIKRTASQFFTILLINERVSLSTHMLSIMVEVVRLKTTCMSGHKCIIFIIIVLS